MINFVETLGYISGYFRVCDGEDTQGLHIFFFLVVALIVTCQIWRFAHTELADNGSGFILFTHETERVDCFFQMARLQIFFNFFFSANFRIETLFASTIKKIELFR